MSARKTLLFALLVAGILGAVAARAVEPGEMLANPALEARAQKIGAALRCLVCQNESIDDSAAPLAHDLRVLIRARLVKGDSDAEAKQYIVARYGEYVLLKPPFIEETYMLWLGPGTLFILALAGFAFYFRGRPKTPAETALSGKEQRRLQDILKDHPGNGDA